MNAFIIVHNEFKNDQYLATVPTRQKSAKLTGKKESKFKINVNLDRIAEYVMFGKKHKWFYNIF